MKKLIFTLATFCSVTLMKAKTVIVVNPTSNVETVNPDAKNHLSIIANPAIVTPTNIAPATGDNIDENEDQTESKNYSYKELKAMAEEASGRKLTLKEKLMLKVAKKKINDVANDASFESGKGKSQITAALLCFFLGFIGIHDFYLGHKWSGIGKIILLAVGIFTLIPLFALSAWVLVDLILILLGNKKPKGGEYAKTL